MSMGFNHEIIMYIFVIAITLLVLGITVYLMNKVYRKHMLYSRTEAFLYEVNRSLKAEPNADMLKDIIHDMSIYYMDNLYDVDDPISEMFILYVRNLDWLLVKWIQEDSEH